MVNTLKYIYPRIYKKQDTFTTIVQNPFSHCLRTYTSSKAQQIIHYTGLGGGPILTW
jgi:hypothetical protein